MQASQETGAYKAELRATGVFVASGLLWVATLALARFGPEAWGESRQVATWAAIVANLAAGVIWIVAFTRFLRAVDELQRKIMLDALAVTLGAGWVAGFGYIVAERAGLVADVDVATLLPLFMAAVFLVAFAVGRIRYR